MDAKHWIVGLTFSLIVGWIITRLFLELLRKAMKLGEKPNTPNEFGFLSAPPWLTGMTERLFFTVLVAFGTSDVATTMVAWLALKLATNWHRYKDDSTARYFGFSALLAGLVSMLFAFLGGLIIRGDLWAQLIMCI